MKNYDELGKFGWYSLLEGSDRAGYGHTWFVDSNGGGANNANAGNGASWAAPFLTLNYAISRCSDGARDVIFVKDGHTENWSTAQTTSGTTTTGCCLDKNDVTIIGLGTGSRRPTFTFTGTAGTLYVDATNCSIYGLIFYSTTANHVTSIDAQSGADGLLVENCKFFASTANTETIDCITLTANCDDVTIRGNKFYNVDTNDGSLAAITCEGASLRLRVLDNVFDGDFNEEVIDMNTAASTEIEIVGNYCNNIDAGYSCFIATHSGCTGVIADNIVYCPAAGSAGGVIADAYCIKANNSVTTVLATEAAAGGGSGGIGNHWYVDSGSGTATNDGRSWATAVTTVDTAIGLATASNGDVIHCAAGHAEGITGATTFIVDMDKIGIAVVGEGTGDARPTFTFATDATNACVDVTAADCRLENLIFACNMADQKYMVYAHTSADDLVIKNCEFREGGQQPLSAILLGGADGQADRVIIDSNRIYLPTAANQDNAIEILFDMTGVEITNNYIMGNFDEACIEIPTGGNACQDLIIKNNILINELTGQHCIEVEQTALTVTGICANNLLVNDSRGICLRPNILNCYGNVWMPLGGNARTVILEGELTTPGQNFYVDSGHGEAVDDTAHGTSWDFPLATLDYAIALCTDNNGDVIHVAPGHAEDYAAAGANLTLDKIGVHIIGYGIGTNRPTFTFKTEVTADIEVDAANCTIENCIFVGDITGLDAPFDIDAANFTLKNCVTRDLGTDICDNWIVGDANADYLTIIGHVHEGTNSANGVSWLSVTGAEFLTVKDCVVAGDFSAACIAFGSAMTDVLIDNCRLTSHNAADCCINGFAASTGMISNTYCSIITDAEVSWITTPGNMTIFECYGANVVGETGMIIGTVSTA